MVPFLSLETYAAFSAHLRPSISPTTTPVLLMRMSPSAAAAIEELYRPDMFTALAAAVDAVDDDAADEDAEAAVAVVVAVVVPAVA